MAELEQPLNAVIVHAGDGVQDAVDLGHGIFMSKDVSNCYLVTTPDGDVLVNTGMPGRGDETKRRFASASDNPVRTIVFTQSHPDHIGGWSTFAGPDVETVVQANYPLVRGYWHSIEPFYLGRTGRLWGRDIKAEGGAGEYPDPAPDTTFHDSHTFELGGRRFEFYSVPGGETLDSVIIWLPEDRIVFTGNLTGPMLGHVPNLYTIRGDKLRSVAQFVASVQRVLDLEPELLITGHGMPIEGAPEVRRILTVIRDAAQYLWDKTWEGMNAGTDLWTLMREIQLPDDLAIPQGHGKVPWIVRAIWEEHAGWFRYESTTELYDVPLSALSSELVEMAGGAAAIIDRAASHLVDGRPLQALHLSDMVLATLPDSLDALEIRSSAAAALLEANGRENFSEVRWLEAEIRDTNAAVAALREI